MSLIVSNTTPKKLKETNLSHYEMVRQFVGKLKVGVKVTYIGWNNIEFDQIFGGILCFKIYTTLLLLRLTVTKRGDLLNLARAANLYYPKTLKNATNKKGNLEYKLDTMAPLNGIKHAAHTAIGDCSATLDIAKIIKRKPLVFGIVVLLTSNKEKVSK